MTTTLVIKNSTDGAAKLSSHMDWAGFKPAPRKIPVGSDQMFLHVADNRGSRGAVVYEVKDGYRWLLAWANQPSVDNQVYTKILKIGEKINWDNISSQLDQGTFTSNHSTAGFTSTVTIDLTAGSPTLRAELNYDRPS
ncbi:uncharacterized protein LOC111295410 [Durio zibethinus]|uniref:Uncharacterized protein LOC111295410 n=1 Tax=Durio zibethinus TaxID=66656 RepID=A0A6P5YWG8_DURZI|nr:uncharacterized protein LOC111295410 [Durio zibethinus]